jgi:uncharacterized membrane protein
MSLQYFAILYAMTGHMQAVSALFESKRLYERDTSASLYSPLVYWLVQATVHLPLLIVSFTVYLNIAYFSMGLPLEFVSTDCCYYYQYLYQGSALLFVVNCSLKRLLISSPCIHTCITL